MTDPCRNGRSEHTFTADALCPIEALNFDCATCTTCMTTVSATVSFSSYNSVETTLQVEK
jgi:hypothetical protein